MNFNVSPQFMTYGINLVGMVFCILILFVFLAKGKSHNISSKVFFSLLVISLLSALFSILASVNVVKNSPSTNLLAVISHIFVNFWNFLLIFYVSICFKSNEENKEFYSKLPYISYVIGIIIFVVIILASIFLKLEFIREGEGHPYLFSGSFLTFTDITGVFAIVYSVICIIMNRDKLDKLTIVLGVYTITSCSLLLGLNMSKVVSFNNTSFLHAFVLFFLYLTIESQDSLLIKEFKDSAQKADEYNKLRSEFIMNMSHELRTPLTSILGFSDSLINSDFTLDEIKEDSKNIYLSSKKLLGLINSIIDVSMFESNKITVNSNNYKLDSVIYDISSIINSYITKENLIFTINADEICPNNLVGDDKKLNKALNIFLMTAIDHTDYGEVCLNVSCNMIDSSNFELIFHIKNSGHALSIDDFNRSLDDLIKLSSDNDNSIDSKTLNLIIAKSLIEIIGGNIEFINEPGKGTQFIVKVKQKITSQERLGNIRDKIQTKYVLSHQILNLSDKRVLIVDSNKMNITILERLLNQYSFNIDTSLSVNDSLGLFNTYVYDMIFVNDVLDGTTGSNFIAKLNSTGNRIPPVVGIVTKNSTNLPDYYDILEAPIEFRNLNLIINKVFEKGGNSDEL